MWRALAKVVMNLWVAVAEAQGQFGNPKEGERPMLETATRGLVKRQHTDKTQRCCSKLSSMRIGDIFIALEGLHSSEI
jgi:hypothetical protein